MKKVVGKVKGGELREEIKTDEEVKTTKVVLFILKGR